MRSQKILLAALALASLLALISLGLWFSAARQNDGLIPRKYRSGLQYALYYPTRLPPGYQVDQTSFKREGDVLIFSIKRAGRKSMVVSQQGLPADQPTHEISKGQGQVNGSGGERNFQTAVGNVHIGLWGDKYVADIITGDSWIIINATGYTADEAAAVAKTFKGI